MFYFNSLFCFRFFLLFRIHCNIFTFVQSDAHTNQLLLSVFVGNVSIHNPQVSKSFFLYLIRFSLWRRCAWIVMIRLSQLPDGLPWYDFLYSIHVDHSHKAAPSNSLFFSILVHSHDIHVKYTNPNNLCYDRFPVRLKYLASNWIFQHMCREHTQNANP